MTYDQVTMSLNAQKIVEEENLKSQSPLHRRCGSNISSGRGNKAKVLRSFEPSTSPLPLRTARNAIDESSVANRKADGISNDGQALNDDGHSKSSSPINCFLQRFSKPSSQKVVREASPSISPLSSEPFPLKYPRLTVSPTLTQNLVPRLPQVAHDDPSKRLRRILDTSLYDHSRPMGTTMAVDTGSWNCNSLHYSNVLVDSALLDMTGRRRTE
ncbi:hypothetical protein BKA61DRAFT_20501 [Leptodontidium sp. MPI-SDFR-AT-0119]|nr:hypothetical protein BKA61DRAFT_20501 [Leptodontidium sp. MPI-SDFR-AT-0119]